MVTAFGENFSLIDNVGVLTVTFAVALALLPDPVHVSE
jgi:hypothetical protein